MGRDVAHLHRAGRGEHVGNGLRLRVPSAATEGALTTHEGVLAPGERVPLHVHDEADQLLYVVDGEVEVTVGSSTWIARREDLVSKPHGVPHGFANIGAEPARVLEITAGDSFERFTRSIAALADPSEFPAVQAAHGIRMPVT